MEKPLYIVWGKVRVGKKRGRSLGFPTANISLHKKIPEGIYGAIVKIDGAEYTSATFVGASTTFKETEKKIEPYLLNFSGDLYGKWISVKLYKKIRENKQFSSAGELSSQIAKDVKDVVAFFNQ